MRYACLSKTFVNVLQGIHSNKDSTPTLSRATIYAQLWSHRSPRAIQMRPNDMKVLHIHFDGIEDE